MRKIPRGFAVGRCIATCFAALALLGPSAGFAQEGLEVSFELDQSSVSAGEPVYVRVWIQNDLSESVGLDPALGLDSLVDLTVTQPDGSVIHVSPPPHGGLLKVPAIRIPPNSRRGASALLNELYQFKKPGDYKLKIKLSGTMRMQSGRTIVPPPQELALRVEPRNAERLEEVCKALAQASAGYSNYEALREAATALSFVQDPVAVPYLGQVLGYGNFVSNIAVRGLVRIGSPEALRALESNLHTTDMTLKLQIQGAIEEIKTGVHPQVMD